jgi:succinyl-diaminopimelate desuccinylase
MNAADGEVVELLQALVRARSDNPPGDERRAAGVVRDYLAQEEAISVEDVGLLPERPLLVARLEGRPGGRTITFNGHLDTVPAGNDWTRDPFGGETEGDRLYGRGSSDMKGGIAGFLAAIRRLAAVRDNWAGTVIAHVVPDEEPGGPVGTESLLKRGMMEGDAVIVAEPSELAVFRAQKGTIFATLRFVGRAAHGSRPEQGVNAIDAAADMIVTLRERLAPELRHRMHELIGSASINVGTISGGTRTNVVPDACTVTIDRRLVPAERLEDATAELEQLIDGRAELVWDHRSPAFETAADHWLVTEAQKAVAAVRGSAPPVSGLRGASDAWLYAQGAGIPTILIGPGEVDQAHIADESASVSLLRESVDVYYELARRLLPPGSGLGEGA